MKRVLIFEDDMAFAIFYIQALVDAGFEVKHVIDSVEFSQLFCEDKNWDVIVFDAWIDSEQEFTYKFVEWVREELGDQVRLVANSTSSENNRDLIKFGCEINSGNRKFSSLDLVEVVQRLTTHRLV